MWEIDNPRVIGMIHNIVTCVQKEDLVDKESKEYFIDLVLSNLMIYSKYNFEEVS